MSKNKNTRTYQNTSEPKEKIEITIGKKIYKIRNNEYFVNMAIECLEEADEEDGLKALRCVFDALRWLYGKDKLAEIAEDNEDMNWADFTRYSIAMASGQTQEEYEESLKEEKESKNA